MEVIDNVISAYEAVKMNGVSQGIIALCSFIAVIIVIQKFVTAWKEAFSEGDKPVDMKQFFKLFYIYIYVFAIIMVAPFAFTIVETALGNLQNELISHYQEDVDLSIDEAIVTFTKDYIEDVQRRHNWVGQQIQEVIMLPFNIAAYTILLYATKYIFFFFASARYLYLILLEIVTPIAVILYMDEKTRHYTHAYLKNLLHDDPGVPDSQRPGVYHCGEYHAHVRTEQIYHAGTSFRFRVQTFPVCQKREILS
jgi:hypothetical protein